MFKDERTQIAADAVNLFIALTGMNAATDTLYIASLGEKIEMILATVDFSAHKIDEPLFIKEAVPGYDIMIYPSKKAVIEEVVEISVEASTALDPRHFKAFQLLLDKFFHDKEEGVFAHESADGMYYIVSQVARREATLTALGFDASELMSTVLH